MLGSLAMEAATAPAMFGAHGLIRQGRHLARLSRQVRPLAERHRWPNLGVPVPVRQLDMPQLNLNAALQSRQASRYESNELGFGGTTRVNGCCSLSGEFLCWSPKRLKYESQAGGQARHYKVES